MKLSERHKQIIKAKICPYCGNKPEFTDSSVVYGVSYGMIYYCRKCDAYVGVHGNSKKALGRLANKELRKAKIEAHKYFDKLWKSRKYKRHQAYYLLSEHLNIPENYTHIGMFSIDTCKKVVDWAKGELKNN